MLLATAAQIREADRLQIETRHTPGILLMESAGRLAAGRIRELYPERCAALVLAGPGNNGGDGLAIARHLHLAGWEVQVLLAREPERFAGDALINYRMLCELPVPVSRFGEERLDEVLESFALPPLLVDALLGTGIRDRLQGPVAELIAACAPLGLPVVAIDLPSGLDADTGRQLNEVLAASHTLTFQLPKVCHAVTPASLACGEVHVLDIGIWPEVLEQLGIRREWLGAEHAARWHRAPRADSHKGTQGHVLLAGGSAAYAGAIALAGYAALRAGAGLATVLAPEACRWAVGSRAAELMHLAAPGQELGPAAAPLLLEALAGKQALVLGPGLGMSEAAAAFLEEVLPEVRVPLLLDADALNLLARHPHGWLRLPEQTILTPHPGEMARLTGWADVSQRRLEAAEMLAQERGVIVVLKGAGTVIALPDGRSYVNRSGNPGMATAGSGDVLAGMTGALLAQGYPPEIAAPMGVWLHGAAGDRAAAQLGQAAVLASDIAEAFRIPAPLP
ncbi:MAG: NAD(P)H-hydrate dehydratase [Bacteroidia bacterium]|nr:NAD(P)H-hydrate dehydratase [Bacteroidia bacterium]